MAHILIIDDEKSVRITLREFLLMDNHQVEVLEGAEGALNLLRNNKIDIVISDLILPRVNGIALLKEIHEQFPDIELIIISGEPTINTATEAIRLGVYDYLPKPVSMKRIRQVVSNAAKVKWLKDTKKALEEENRIYRENLETLVAERTSELLKLNQSLEKEITRRKTAESEQRLANERLAIITDGIPALIAYVSADERYLYVNSSYADWLDVAKESLIGQPLADHLPDDVYQIFSPQIRKVLSGQRVSFRFYYNDLTQKSQIIRSEFVPTLDEAGSVNAFYVLIENITVQEKLQKEAVKARQLDSIELVTRNLANDLNNILTVIMGYLGLSIQKTDKDDHISNYLLKSEEAANEAKLLVETDADFFRYGDHQEESGLD
jgi:DNA-binding NarL/FixJ family response regulator